MVDLELPITMRRHSGSVSFATPENVGAADLTFDGWWSDVSADLELPVTLTADSWNGVDRVSHPLVIDGR